MFDSPCIFIDMGILDNGQGFSLQGQPGVSCKGHPVKSSSFLFHSQGRVKICCAANQLFQDLLKNLDLKNKSLMQDQVLNSVVPLLLNMQEQHPEVVKVSNATPLGRDLFNMLQSYRTENNVRR